MIEGWPDNSSIVTNFKALSKSISSAQSNIFRCKSTLKCIEEELIYLNVNNNTNTNTNNRDSKKLQKITGHSDHGSTPLNTVEIDAEPSKIADFLSLNSLPESFNKTLKNRRFFSKILNPEYSNNNLAKNSNTCNISSELNNLMKAQQKLISQIEQLKCEICEKSGAIDICLKDNQYFNCKFKEVDCDINLLKNDVDRIKRELAVTSNRDRGFSPYSQESAVKDPPNIPSLRQFTGRTAGVEHHFGYQDVCTPENSLITGPSISKTNRNVLINIRDPQSHSKTFEDLMRKNKVDIDCNINNCRNNQNTCSIIPPVQSNPVLQDFACLTNQIKNLRKMAEAIFKGNCPNNRKKRNVSNHTVEANTTKNVDATPDELSKPIAETTLFMLNRSHSKSSGLINSINKRDSSSERTSLSGYDTSACVCTDDQMVIYSPHKNIGYQVASSKSQDHISQDKNESNNLLNMKKKECTKFRNRYKQYSWDCLKKNHIKLKDHQMTLRKQEMECNYSKHQGSINCQMKNHSNSGRSVCPECCRPLIILSN